MTSPNANMDGIDAFGEPPRATDPVWRGEAWDSLDMLKHLDLGDTEIVVLGAEQYEALRGIVQRVNEGWEYVKPSHPAPKAQRGVWYRIQDGANRIVMTTEDERVPQEPMLPEEQKAIYGSVVREEST